MNTSGEVADLMVKEGIQVTESAVKLTALGVKNLAALVIALANDNIKLQGKTNIKNLIKSDKPLCILQINEKDIAKFNAEAKKYGVLFTAITDKTNKTDKCDIIAKQEDAAKLNYILEQKLGYVAPVQDTEPEKETEAETPEQENTAPEKDAQTKEKAQEENEKNAQTRQSEKNRVSENSSIKYGNTENTDNPIEHRPSVRKKVEDIKEQRANAKADKQPEKYPKHEHSQQPKGKGKKGKNKSKKGKNKGK